MVAYPRRSIMLTNSWRILESVENGPSPSGRRQVMVLKDAELVLAVGKELRMTSLGDTKLGSSAGRSSKILKTPSIEFEIHQLALNPSGKLLAVAGASQVAVVVLPRAGYAKLVPTSIECKSISVGQFYHASSSSAPVVKIEWHPWGEAGSTLMVMTVDGKLREYDISVDTDEPQQILSFVPDKKTKSYLAEDPSEREVASFTLGKGIADWGPLTVYAVMKSGDIYSICPYMPKNASIPTSYIHALECFIAAKQEFLSQGGAETTPAHSTLYNYQRQYVSALIKQLPPGTVFPAVSRSVLMHPPTTIKNHPARQGPFLLQPSPHTLHGSEGGDATDIAYIAFVNGDEEDDEGETERLGVVVVTYKDGKVDVYLDVEKVEARWESKQHPHSELPMLAVFESIDLGLIASLDQSSSQNALPVSLLQTNYPVIHMDPIHDDVVYVYHAFGVNVLDFGVLLRSLSAALRVEGDIEGSSLTKTLQNSKGTRVSQILNTFSVERKCSNPVIAVSVPNDIYLTYSIIILTSAMRITSFPLSLRSDDSSLQPQPPNTPDKTSELRLSKSTAEPPAYVSLLGTGSFTPPPILSRPLGLPSNARLAIGSQQSKAEFTLTPDTLRYLGTTVANFTSQIHDTLLAYKAVDLRLALQKQEYSRQQDKCREMVGLINDLQSSRHDVARAQIERIRATHKVLLTRLDRILQSMMQQASPELSEYEKKWFEELRRMKMELAGEGRYDEGSLAARTSLLRREHDRILPNLTEMITKENKWRVASLEKSQGLGVSQAFELGERSHIDRTKIAELEQEVADLAGKLDLSLARPPPLREEHS
ncbi:hypothetical protein SERLADRAFT_446672 [Serpula lacrymans var. lacrymans S7.9]|uniref:Uncharacterized protein n=1 Tax=Serpula lacrymans var. lacrymans (strain S7.9) TaxID=578457 RepID=F8NMP4_SERL9|nr:uncharacterized protein SERLADRAFT_446672 [Serpula lacrymans var. lacrymans S7.9]EGO27441.1 hypothetical protein SERLADRAFT_446672 [Serpula lacrymans var. lacrymans S7.9]